jgi:hypothetical protein
MAGVAALGANGAPATAHSLSSAQISTAAKAAAAALKRQTHASSSSVRSCRRRTAHLATCSIDLRYSSGASRCNVKVDIRLVSAHVRWVAGQTVCF